MENSRFRVRFLFNYLKFKYIANNSGFTQASEKLSYQNQQWTLTPFTFVFDLNWIKLNLHFQNLHFFCHFQNKDSTLWSLATMVAYTGDGSPDLWPWECIPGDRGEMNSECEADWLTWMHPRRPRRDEWRMWSRLASSRFSWNADYKLQSTHTCSFCSIAFAILVGCHFSLSMRFTGCSFVH